MKQKFSEQRKHLVLKLNDLRLFKINYLHFPTLGATMEHHETKDIAHVEELL